ncbi:transmembrane channel-like protein 7 [Ruditapes philippinarum]|uniref:transmembrane channel-like protein 7 n=1 Tax=Ruditapes philippinarum TaxID=129788 RepID=UPI00295BB06C|nr:transmembrane channel-like protein 7 [Ruditapes philippinarum]
MRSQFYFQGWMETTSFFYGYYGNTEVSIPGGEYNIPLAYCLTTLIILIVSLFVMVHYTFTKYTDTIVSTDIASHNSSAFFISVCCGWDYRIFEEKSVPLQHRHIFQRFCGALEDQKHEIEKKESSSCARFCLWVIRIAVNVLILILLGATAAAIYFAQTFSSNFITSDKKEEYNMVVRLFVQFLPSLLIASVNAIYPIIFLLLARLEKYRPSSLIQITLLRLITTKFDWNLAKKIGPAEFDIAICVLDLVYGQALCW